MHVLTGMDSSILTGLTGMDWPAADAMARGFVPGSDRDRKFEIAAGS
jgi:hypothetical protein